MSITSALVLFAIIWFTTLFVVLPLRNKSQSDTGEIVPGTPGSAPVDPQLKRKFILVTLITIPLWAVVTAIIFSGWISVDDFDLFHLLSGYERS